MASSSDNISMAVFCDFENVALGVRDANYEKFDIKPVLERLLLKGSIVVKKAYCDWERYKGFKATMHEANFELIEIPHVRQSGKNSADIRLVVDALDLCYTKSHVNTFVIISGDSDFSPLVSKLRENAKQVIGVGVKQSTSDLLVANCDEFIFYDDLVREVRRAAAKRDERKVQPAAKRSPDEGNRRKEELEERKAKAIEMVVEMFDALVSERGDSGKIWASLLKDTLKRRRPDFNEAYFGFRTFGNLLEEAQARGMLEFGRDEKSGAYVYRSSGAQLPAIEALPQEVETAPEVADEIVVPQESGRRGRGGRKQRDYRADVNAEPVEHAAHADHHADHPADAVFAPAEAEAVWHADVAAPELADADVAEVVEDAAPVKPKRKLPRDSARKSAAKKAKSAAVTEQSAPEPAPVAEPAVQPAPAPAPAIELASEGAAEETKAKPARKPAARGRRPAKPKAAPDNG